MTKDDYIEMLNISMSNLKHRMRELNEQFERVKYWHTGLEELHELTTDTTV